MSEPGWYSTGRNIGSGPGKELAYWNGTEWNPNVTSSRTRVYATFSNRVGYTIIDTIILATITLLLTFPVRTEDGLGGSLPADHAGEYVVMTLGNRIVLYLSNLFIFADFIWFGILSLLIEFAFYAGFLYFFARTPGQMLTKKTVVDISGAPVTRQGKTVTFRTFFLVLFKSFPLIGLIDILWCIWDKDKQTLHDKIAKTYVFQDWYQQRAEMPPPSVPTQPSHE